MDGKKEDMSSAYANEVPDLHDEKATGKVVEEAAVHSVALTEALAMGPKPSIWSKSMLKLYFIMGECLRCMIHGLALSNDSQVSDTWCRPSTDTIPR